MTNTSQIMDVKPAPCAERAQSQIRQEFERHFNLVYVIMDITWAPVLLQSQQTIVWGRCLQDVATNVHLVLTTNLGDISLHVYLAKLENIRAQLVQEVVRVVQRTVPLHLAQVLYHNVCAPQEGHLLHLSAFCCVPQGILAGKHRQLAVIVKHVLCMSINIFIVRRPPIEKSACSVLMQIFSRTMVE
jgi:hypothetical protein